MMSRRLIALAAGIAAVLVLLGLGVWQVERLQWKRALIAQVERRLAAAPVAAPGPANWAAIGKDDAYTRVRVTGRWAGRDTPVQAVTDLGGGYWVLTPLATREGWTVLVNRGFVPPDASSALRKDDGEVTVTGLLRVTEPGGGFLRRNDPAANRWYSRDVAAIAASQGAANVAPYFIDADRQGDGWPRGGMTVVRFPDNHLVYALTWFALAGLVAFLLWRVARR
jgi:surfeit locus 1 family protein